MKYKIFILDTNDFEGEKILSTIRNEITYENEVSFSVGEELFDVSQYHILIDKCLYDIYYICCGYLYYDIYLYTRNKNTVKNSVSDFIDDTDNNIEVIIK